MRDVLARVPTELTVAACLLTSCHPSPTAAVETDEGSGTSEADTDGEPTSPGDDADSSDATGNTDPTSDGTGGPGDTGDTGIVDGKAFGLIALAEIHPAMGGTATGGVVAAFFPNSEAAGTASCGREVEGCTISLTPHCETGCGESQYCGQVSGTVDDDGNVVGTALYGGASCDFTGTSDGDTGSGTLTCDSPACTGTWEVEASG